MTKSLHVIVIRISDPSTVLAKSAKIEAAINPLGDWLRFSSTNWFIYSDKPSIEIYRALTAVLTKDDSEIVMKADPSDYSGWSAKWVDDWLKAKVSPPSVQSALWSNPLTSP